MLPLDGPKISDAAADVRADVSETSSLIFSPLSLTASSEAAMA